MYSPLIGALEKAGKAFERLTPKASANLIDPQKPKKRLENTMREALVRGLRADKPS